MIYALKNYNSSCSASDTAMYALTLSQKSEFGKIFLKEKISELDKKMHELAWMKKSLSQVADCHCHSLQSCVKDI